RGPGVTAVPRHVQVAAGAAADHLPRLAPRLPQASEDHPRVRAADADVGGARLSVLVRPAAPRRAADGTAVHVARAVAGYGGPEDSGEAEVGVLGIDGNRAGLPDRLPDVLPALAAVGGLEDAGAGGDVAADVRLAGADVDDVRVTGRDRDAADGAGGLVVEDGLPGVPGVGALPHPAGGGGRVVGQRVARHATRTTDAAAGERADQPVLHRGEVLRLVRPADRRATDDHEQNDEQDAAAHDDAPGGRVVTALPS